MSSKRIFPVLVLLTWMTGGLAMAQKVPGEAILRAIEKLETRFGLTADQVAIVVDPAVQELYLVKDRSVLATYAVSTGAKGLGNREGSYQTPTGTHRVRSRFGDGAAIGTIFRARRNTGKIAKIYTEPVDIPEDDVTTRILRLEGMEPGINRGGDVDSYKRYIYIHGTPEEGLIGRPASHGCVRMINADVIELFEQVSDGTLVEILDRPYVDK